MPIIKKEDVASPQQAAQSVSGGTRITSDDLADTSTPTVGAPENSNQPHGATGNAFTSPHPLETLRANYDEAARPSNESDPHPLLHDLGRGFTETLAGPLVHPLDTIKSMAHGAVHMQPSDPENPVGQMIGSTVQDFSDNGASKAVPHLLGQAGGAFLGGEMGGEALGATTRLGNKIASNVGERISGYKSPVIEPALQQGSKIARAIGSSGGITPTLEGDLGAQAPIIKGYAQGSGNPLHSQWEVAQAARESANQDLAHWNSILNQYGGEASPISAKPVAVWDDAQGRMRVPDAPTVNPQSINSRITEINNLLRPAGNAKTVGATMTAVERSGLSDELNQLRSQLYGEMGERTGIDPDIIKGFREGYGQRFGIADAIDQSRRARLGQMGMADEGGSSLPTSKSGLIDKALTGLRGGREYLADSNMRSALKDIQPQSAQRPQPVLPIDSGPDVFMGAKTPARAPLWDGIQPSRPPTPSFTPDPEALSYQAAKLASRGQPTITSSKPILTAAENAALDAKRRAIMKWPK